MTATLAAWHPFVVHFAVAFALGSAVFDVADFLRKNPRLEYVGFVLMLSAVPFLLLAVLTGNLAEGFLLDARAEAIVSVHQSYANFAVFTFCGAGLWRVFLRFRGSFRGGRKVAYIFIVTAAAASVFLAARKGGEIRHTPYPPAPQDRAEVRR